MMTGQNISECMLVARAHPDLNQGPADLQSAALTTELCTRIVENEDVIENQREPQ